MPNTKSVPASLERVRAAEPSVLERVIAIAPAPLLPGEKESDYASLAKRVVDAAKPQDTIEELLIRDVIDLSWEIFRLRRAKGGILKASMSAGVEKVLKALGHGPEFSSHFWSDLSKRWVTGEKNASKEVETVLGKAQLSIDDVTAMTLEYNIDSYERLDRMMASAEARRNNAFREIDRHRSVFGAAVRQAVDEAEDVEFRDVETGEVVPGARP